MAGAPDIVGLTAQAVSAIITAITPDFLLVPLRALKEELLNTLLVNAIGMNKQQLKDYLTQPDRYFDQVMTAGGGTHVTLAQFNADYLHLADPGYANPGEAFDYHKVPAAYNTVILSKLILVSPQTIDELMMAGDPGRLLHPLLQQPNVMLGFIRTLDGSLQWQSGFVPAEDCMAYDRIFMALPGASATTGPPCQGFHG